MFIFSSLYFLITGFFYFWLNFIFWGLDEEHFIMFALVSIFFILYSFLRNVFSNAFFSQIEFIYLFFLYLIKLNLGLLDKFFLYKSILNFQLKFNYNFLIFDVLNVFLNKLVVFDFYFWYSSLNFLITFILSSFVDLKNRLNSISEIFIDLLNFNVNNILNISSFFRFSTFWLLSESFNILKNSKNFFK